MRRTMRLWAGAVLVTLVGTTDAGAQVTPADYDRAMGLRDRWMYLTENVADPATWVDGTSRFYYRKTVKGGFQFVMVDAQTLQRQPAFDHDKLAVGLGAATGEKYTGLRLPFDTFRFSGGERAIEITFNESAWTCRLPDTPAPAARAEAVVAVSHAVSARYATRQSHQTTGRSALLTGAGKHSSATTIWSSDLSTDRQ